MTRAATFLLVTGSVLLMGFPGRVLQAQSPDSLPAQPYLTLSDSLIHYEKKSVEDIRLLEITSAWILVDSTGELDIGAVAGPAYQHRFSPNRFIGEPFPIGLVVWVRLRLEGDSRLPVQQYEMFLQDYLFPSQVFERTGSGPLSARPTGVLCKLPPVRQWRLRRMGTLTFSGAMHKEVFLRLERSNPLRIKMVDHWGKVRILISGEETFADYWWIKNALDYLFSGIFLCLFVVFLILMRSVNDPSLKWLTFTIPFFIFSTDLAPIAGLIPDALFIRLVPWTFYICIILFTIFMKVYSRQRVNMPVLDRLYRIWPVFIFVFPLLLRSLCEVLISSATYPQLLSPLSWIFGLINRIAFYGTGLLALAFAVSIAVRRREERNVFLAFIGLFVFFAFGHRVLVPADIPMSGLASINILRVLSAAFMATFAEVIGKQYRGLQLERLTLQQNLNRELEVQVRTRTRELNEKNLELASRNEQLIQLDQEKNNLINIVAHDLGSPLASIKMYSGIVQKAKDKLPVKYQEYLDGISSTAQHGVEMIRRILDVNAIDQNGQQLEVRSTDVLPILQAAVNDFRGLAGRKDIQLVFECPEQPVERHIDPAAFRQVIDNLLSNAVKFSPPGRTVAVGLEQEVGSDTVRIYVRDQGPGIAPEDMPKLFQRYARLSAQPTGGETSTGLGLAIVRQYVEAMNGRVWAENNQKEGATFWVVL